MHGVAIDAATIEKIRAYYKEGKTQREIARLIGRSKSSVGNIVHRFINSAPGDNSNNGAKKPVATFSGIGSNNKTVVSSLDDFSLSEIFKYLYRKGVRIQDGQVVIMKAVPLDIENIIRV